MLKPVFENPWVRAGALLGGIVLFLFLVFLLKSVLVPLFIAFIVAYIFDPVVDIFERRYKSRMGAVLVVVFGLILVAVLLPVLVLPGVISQAEELVQAASAAEKDQWLDGMLSSLPLDDWVIALGWAEEGQEDLNARAVVAEKLGEFIKANALNFFEQYGKDLLSASQSARGSAVAFFGSVGSGILGFIGFLGSFVLFTFVTIYLLKDYDRIIAGMDELVPPRFRPQVRHIAKRIDNQLRGFMRGQLTVCLFLGVMYTVGMSIAGTPFAVPLGILGGAASFIPYVGIVMTVIPAVLLTLLQYGIDWHILVVLVTFGLAQALEGNLITPKFVGEQVGLEPVWVILAIMVFSTSFGFVGLLVALPSAAILKVFVEEGLAWYKKSLYFVGEASLGKEDGDSG